MLYEIKKTYSIRGITVTSEIVKDEVSTDATLPELQRRSIVIRSSCPSRVERLVPRTKSSIVPLTTRIPSDLKAFAYELLRPWSRLIWANFRKAAYRCSALKWLAQPGNE